MQEILSRFSTTMTWVVLLFCLVVVILMGESASSLPQNRCRAFLGVMAMALVWGAAGIRHVLLFPKGNSPSRLLLPLAVALLMFSLYRLGFPSPVPAQTPHQNHWRSLLLLLLTVGAFIIFTGLILLDLLFLEGDPSLSVSPDQPITVKELHVALRKKAQKIPGLADQASRHSFPIIPRFR